MTQASGRRNTRCSNHVGWQAEKFGDTMNWLKELRVTGGSAKRRRAFADNAVELTNRSQKLASHGARVKELVIEGDEER